MRNYVYDQAWEGERRRLAGIERLWDAGSRAILERIGLAPSWRCLELGAGGGSMTAWLAERTAHVTAVDLDPRFLTPMASPRIDVRRLDIREEELPARELDLVYARMVVEHIGAGVIPRLARALRPGGWLLIEDLDWGSAAMEPADPSFDRVVAGVLGFMTRAGFDPLFGRRLPRELRAAGLRDVEAEGRVRLIRGGSDETAFYRMSLHALRDRAIAAGALREEDVESALRELDGDRIFFSPVMVAAWARARA